MQRSQSITDDEVLQRREKARLHILKEGIQSDMDMWADYELYIQGKMSLEEYQRYLLFKHASCTS